jgi:hypothetical protein
LVDETAGGTKTTALGSRKGAFGSENACRRQFFRRSATKLIMKTSVPLTVKDLEEPQHPSPRHFPHFEIDPSLIG